MKVMNGPRYNFFWIYILDLHNNYIEDNRLLRVNPLSPICMNEILIKKNKQYENVKILIIFWQDYAPCWPRLVLPLKPDFSV